MNRGMGNNDEFIGDSTKQGQTSKGGVSTRKGSKAAKGWDQEKNVGTRTDKDSGSGSLQNDEDFGETY